MYHAGEPESFLGAESDFWGGIRLLGEIYRWPITDFWGKGITDFWGTPLTNTDSIS